MVRSAWRSSPQSEVLAMEICESACPSPAKNNFTIFHRWSACSEKKERKNLSTCSNEMNPNSTRNTNFAKFSRENLAQFGLQKCLFRYGENTICYKNVVFTSAVPGPLGWMCLIFLQVRQEQTPLRYSKQITIKTRPFTNPSFANQQ